MVTLSALSTGKFSMDIFTMSLRDSFLLASRISMPMMCLFSSRSTVTPSSMSILSSTFASLSWIYRASASLSYSILKTAHLHLFFFLSDIPLMCKPMRGTAFFLTWLGWCYRLSNGPIRLRTALRDWNLGAGGLGNGSHLSTHYSIIPLFQHTMGCRSWSDCKLWKP
jgi:hypothetical protein